MSGSNALRPAVSHAKTRAGLTSWGDLRYFLNYESLLVAAGTIILVALELNLLDSRWPITDWVEDWKWLVVMAAVVLILLPPIAAKGFLHLRTRDRNAKRNIEVTAALKSIRGRTANLTAKASEIQSGHRSGTYINHTLAACANYFKNRKTIGGEAVDFRMEEIDLVYYARADSSQTRQFQKKQTTSTESARFRGTISSRGNAGCRQVVDAICGGDGVSSNTLQAWTEAFFDGETEYRRALAVPVRRDKSDEAEVIGILLAVASAEDALHESDREFLATYAWFISAAKAMEAIREPSTSTSEERATIAITEGMTT